MQLRAAGESAAAAGTQDAGATHINPRHEQLTLARTPHN